MSPAYHCHMARTGGSDTVWGGGAVVGVLEVVVVPDDEGVVPDDDDEDEADDADRVVADGGVDETVLLAVAVAWRTEEGDGSSALVCGLRAAAALNPPTFGLGAPAKTVLVGAFTCTSTPFALECGRAIAGVTGTDSANTVTARKTAVVA